MDSSDEERHALLSQYSTSYRRMPRIQLSNYHKAWIFILVAEVIEKFVNISLVGNMSLLFQQAPLCWDEMSIAHMSIIMSTISGIMGLVGGMVSDAKRIGRFRLMVFTYCVYLIVPIWLTVLTAELEKENQNKDSCMLEANLTNATDRYPAVCEWSRGGDGYLAWGQICGTQLMICMIIVCSAGAFLHTNFSIFGREQVLLEHRSVTRRFISLYFIAINLGALLAFIPMTFLHLGYVYYLFVTIGIVVSGVIFFTGKKFYVIRIPHTYPICTVVKVIACSIKQRWYRRRDSERLPVLFDYALQVNGGRYPPAKVSAVKSLWRVFRVLTMIAVTYMIAFSEAYVMFFLQQALHMNVDLKDAEIICPNEDTVKSMIGSMCGSGGTSNTTTRTQIVDREKVPPASLKIVGTISVVVFLLLLNKIYEWIARCGIQVTVSRVLITGHIFLALSLLVAGILEIFRLEKLSECGYFLQKIGNELYEAVDINVFLQIPQFILLGISNVFVFVTALEYAFMESPDFMLGFIVGLFWFALGIGSLLLIAVTKLVKFIPDILTYNELNCNKEYGFLFILIGWVLLGCLAIFFSSRRCDLRLDEEVMAFKEDRPARRMT